MEKFVIQIKRDNAPAAYFSASTTADNALVEDLNSAIVYSTKAEARAISGRYQASFPDFDVAVVPVRVSISLV